MTAQNLLETQGWLFLIVSLVPALIGLGCRSQRQDDGIRHRDDRSFMFGFCGGLVLAGSLILILVHIIDWSKVHG